jgi:cystathionine beta-lyase/cystathionine gamma-synthase
MGFSTDAIHVGQEPDPLTGSIVAPIYQTSTYVIEAMGKSKGYDYARTNHPNRKALERTVAKLEGGHAAYVFTSGMAAIDSVFRLLRPGDHLILSQAVYGGVFRLTTQLLAQFGIEFSYVDTSQFDKLTQAIKLNTKMIYIETPTNPTMIVTDIAAAAKIAHDRNLMVVVDNTFLSPYLQKPIALGADIVVHSMTKFLNGHSDCTGGAVIVTTQAQADQIYFIQRSAGAGLAPMDCFLVSRGLKTLAVRMERHNSNGMAVANHLKSHPKVEERDLPGSGVSPPARNSQAPAARLRRYDLFRLGAGRFREELPQSRENLFVG